MSVLPVSKQMYPQKTWIIMHNNSLWSCLHKFLTKNTMLFWSLATIIWYIFRFQTEARAYRLFSPAFLNLLLQIQNTSNMKSIWQLFTLLHIFMKYWNRTVTFIYFKWRPNKVSNSKFLWGAICSGNITLNDRMINEKQ